MGVSNQERACFVKIRLADGLKGEFILHSIGRSIYPDKELVITPEQYENNDIQHLVRNKKLIIVEGREETPYPDGIDLGAIYVYNASRYPIVCPEVPFVMHPAKTYRLTTKQYQSGRIQQALAWKRLIETHVEDTELHDCGPEEIDLGEEDVPQEELPQEEAKTDESVVEPNNADHYNETRQAQTFMREQPSVPKGMHVHDPNGTLKQPKNTPAHMHAYSPFDKPKQPTQPAQPTVKQGNVNQAKNTIAQAKAAIKPAGGRKIKSAGSRDEDGESLGDADVEVRIL